MKLIKNEDALKFKNSPTCIATEYDFEDETDFNIANIELNGRYPEKGYVLNTVSKMLLYVANGEGVLFTDGQDVALKPGDVALIQTNEKYYLDGKLELVISSSPAWRPEQYKNIL